MILYMYRVSQNIVHLFIQRWTYFSLFANLNDFFTLLPSKSKKPKYSTKGINVVKSKHHDLFHKRFHIPSGFKSVSHETFS